jgi:hypothetical protein
MNDSIITTILFVGLGVGVLKIRWFINNIVLNIEHTRTKLISSMVDLILLCGISFYMIHILENHSIQTTTKINPTYKLTTEKNKNGVEYIDTLWIYKK